MSRSLRFVRPALAALMLALMIGSVVSSPASAQTPTVGGSPAAGGEADLAAVKAYLVDQISQMKAATAQNREIVQRYYDLASNAQFDYEGLWETNQVELSPLLAVSK